MSSDDVILSVRNVSKCFEMYEKPVHRLYQTLCAGHKKFYREFWALRDVSFEVRKGESVGVIGRNGAGKSTLLQIIAGTLAPTAGEVKLKGRVAALLELGSGFNPDFTGRENVYLNGAILGLTTPEIDAKYDEIIEFADIGEFIDQPVKTYSSGMMVRLAFAVQVMVEPDILIVDEALSVGDAAFQRKCMARMDRLIQHGTSIFLVTHDTSAVKRFCQKCIFLRSGKVDYLGDAEEAITRYYNMLFPQAAKSSALSDAEDYVTRKAGSGFCLETKGKENTHKWGMGDGLISNIRIWGLEEGGRIKTPGTIEVEVSAAWDSEALLRKIAKESLPENVVIGVLLTNKENIRVFGTNTMLDGIYLSPFELNKATVRFALQLPALKPGDYFITAAISLGKENLYFDLQWQDVCVQFSVYGKVMRDYAGIAFMPHESTLIEGGASK